MAQWLNPRGIKERIVVCGVLKLETPTHLGNGDAEGPLDMPLLLDPLESKALLTGSTLAGALRNYLRTLKVDDVMVNKLFGSALNKEDEENAQSLLIVDDALGERPKVELRDGVAINPKTRTAKTGKKFDIELLEAGTGFELRFELVKLKNDSTKDADALLQTFALALRGLELGEIRLGKRKRRGFGCCRVREWSVQRYDVSTPEGMIAWLEGGPAQKQCDSNIASLLGVSVEGQTHRQDCTLEGTFVVDGSLLIRSGFGEGEAADHVHLRSMRSGEYVPILSGASLAGALRSRALRIANTMGKDGKHITDSLFGLSHNSQIEEREAGESTKKYTASRLWTDETLIENGIDLVQTRLKIDRFTGGSYPGALFNEQPIFGKLSSETTVKVSVKIEKPTDSEVGLLLLLLKDLWTGDLPLGGESSVGRGRLKGKKATLVYKGRMWDFYQENLRLQVKEGESDLESFVQAFIKEENNG